MPETKKKTKTKSKTKSRTKSKAKKRTWLRIGLILLSLVIIFLALCYITPSTEEEGLTSQGEIENLEIPVGPDDSIVVEHTGYTLSYCEEYEVPYWVAYSLTKEEVSTQVASRDDNFREDPSITTGSATLQDYRKSGYDRGHMAPAADFKWSEDAMSDTFYLSNMCPQTHAFNAGIWSDLESAVRSIAYTDGEVYVVTGPVLTDGPYETIGENKVAVPKYYYKVILDYTDPVIKAIGFILPAENSSEPLSYFAVTVDEVEERTGIDFFPALPDDIEDTVESQCDASLWALRQFSLSSEEVSTEALEYTSSSTTSSSTNETVTELLELFNSQFYRLKKEVFSALGITKYMRAFGFI